MQKRKCLYELDEVPIPYQSIEEFNSDIDTIFEMMYMHPLLEKQGISFDNFNLLNDIYPYIQYHYKHNNKFKYYTEYNWDFDKKKFIKLSDNTKPYPFYIYIYTDNSSNAKLATTFRNIEKEKQGNTDIIIFINKTLCAYDDLYGTIIHEVQHVKEMYICKDKNVVYDNKTNIYNYHEHSNKVYKDLLYIMSEPEQHAIIQELYNYVYKHSDVTYENMLDHYKVISISNIQKFSQQYYALENYMNIITLARETRKMFMHFCKLLKTNFGYKNPKFTDKYMQDIINGNIEISTEFELSILEFIKQKQKEYRRKIYKTVYNAIQDRENNS